MMQQLVIKHFAELNLFRRDTLFFFLSASLENVPKWRSLLFGISLNVKEVAF